MDFDDITLVLLNCGLKFTSTSVGKPGLGKIQPSVAKWARNVGFILQFGNNSTKNFDPNFYVPHPGVMPHPAPAAFEQFLSYVNAAMLQCYGVADRFPAAISSNINVQQQRALQQLKHDRRVIIKPSGKNLGPVILDSDFYC